MWIEKKGKSNMAHMLCYEGKYKPHTIYIYIYIYIFRGLIKIVLMKFEPNNTFVVQS